MANTMGYHDIERSIPRQPQQGKEANMPPQANIVAAASRIRQLFEIKQFVYCIMGGFQMFCLGNEREVSDLHIAYDDKDFSRIRKKLEADRRVRLPEGMNPLLASKILVDTGPSYQDVGCTRSATVEVNLLPPGSCGTPPSGTLNDNVVLLSHKVGGVLKTFKGLNMLYLVRTLVQFCWARELTWNPQQDILFLCQRYGGQIQSVWNQLDQEAIHQNFLNTPFFAGLSFEDQRRCYQILAGQAPSPSESMSLPVPHNSHFYSQPTPNVPRARVISYNSSFAPTTSSLHSFQGPRQLQKDRPIRKHAANVSLPHINLPPDLQSGFEGTISARDSGSRYLPISTPNSRRTSPVLPQVSGGPLKETKSDTRLRTTSQSAVTAPSTTARDMGPKPHMHTARAQVSYHVNQSNRSGRSMVPQKPQHQHHSSMFEMSARPTQYNSKQATPTTNHTPLISTAQGSTTPTSELAAASPEKKDIMASLSASIDAAIQISNDSRLASPPTPVQNMTMPPRPLHPRTVSAPLAMLPASLIAGYGNGSKPCPPPLYGRGSGGIQCSTPPSEAMEPQTVQVCTLPLYQGNAPYDGGDDLQHVQADLETSVDSRTLAMEYRAEMPEFEDGYGRW